MWYLIGIGILIIIVLLLTFRTVFKLWQEGRAYKREKRDYEDDTAELVVEYDDEDEEPEPIREKGRRQWKVLFQNQHSGQEHSFVFYDGMEIGRRETPGDFDVFLEIEDDARISKRHCAIFVSRGRLYLEDLGSSNHTYLNGKLVGEPEWIQKEDVITIGRTKLEIVKILREAQ